MRGLYRHAHTGREHGCAGGRQGERKREVTELRGAGGGGKGAGDDSARQPSPQQQEARPSRSQARKAGLSWQQPGSCP